MDGRRMTGPEPRMASTDDAMEAQPLRGVFRLKCSAFKCSVFRSARQTILKNRSGPACHHRSMERSDIGPKRMAQRRPRKAAPVTLPRDQRDSA